ncbi:MAG TPA: molybdate ABC transporter substrate-binding protein [Candidatus Limnocylindria bacterium]|nr:molybdate ABC transporter substrate-binding protein [Candidatus Limnocylindria bacterium]
MADNLECGAGKPRNGGWRRGARHLLWLATFAVLVVRASAAEITVFAAASLAESLQEIAGVYQQESGDKVTFNFGASSLLARQIEEGAPADLFFSADEAKMDALDGKGLIVKETRKSRLGNTLVIVVASDRPLAISAAQDLADPKVKRLALAEPKSVPAGIYAKEYLTRQKLWTAVEPKVVPTENVRAALAAVESGNVDAGIVYQTDAAISQQVKVAFVVPAAEGPMISYPLALLKESKHPDAAKKFLAYLEAKAAGGIFRRYGFIVHP